MEILGALDLPAWLLILVGLVIVIIMHTYHRRTIFSRYGIKEKKTMFLLGDILYLRNKGMRYLDPELVKKEGKIIGTFIGNKPLLHICDVDIVKQMLVKEFSNFTNRPKPVPLKHADSLIFLAEDFHWKFLRSVLSPVFTSGKLRGISRFVQKNLDDMFACVDEKMIETPSGIDVFALFQNLTIGVITATSFGVETNAFTSQSTLIKRLDKIGKTDFTKSPGFIFRALFSGLAKWLPPLSMFPEDALTSMQDTLKSAIQERRANPSEHKDLLQLMINATRETDSTDGTNKQETLADFKERGLTDEEVLVNSLLFVMAGYLTTSTSLSWSAYRLVIHPEWQDRLRTEVDTHIGQGSLNYDNIGALQDLDMFIKEVLRLDAITQGLSRIGKKDITINGVTIPGGVQISVPVSVMHYLPEYWPEPHKFDPERFSPENKHKLNEYAYIPFGNGPRNCIGMRLAMLEMKMTLAAMLQRYTFLKGDSLQIPMPKSNAAVSVPASPVMVRLVKRSDQSH